MADHRRIDSLSVGDELRDTYIIHSASIQHSRNGDPYWRLELKDASGSLEAKIWSPLSQTITSLSPGQLVEVAGRVSLYREQIQVIVEELRFLDEQEIAELPLKDFVKASPRPSEDMLTDIENLCGNVLTHRPWRKFLRSVLGDKRIRPLLLQASAARSVHHAYAGGLLEHMLSVAELCMLMADHYPELDRQTLLAAALLHDIGKIDEMRGLLETDYTDEGKFLGHIVQGLLLLEPFLQKAGVEPELAMHFKHLIASHHGEPEFGAVRLPLSPEAFALHYADMLDAKLAQCRSVLPEDEGEGMAWSPYQSLLGRSLCRAARTPEDKNAADAPSEKAKKQSKEDLQCSLL